MPFMGHVISASGLAIVWTYQDQGIQEIPTSTCKQDMKCLLGMANYLQICQK